MQVVDVSHISNVPFHPSLSYNQENLAYKPLKVAFNIAFSPPDLKQFILWKISIKDSRYKDYIQGNGALFKFCVCFVDFLIQSVGRSLDLQISKSVRSGPFPVLSIFLSFFKSSSHCFVNDLFVWVDFGLEILCHFRYPFFFLSFIPTLFQSLTHPHYQSLLHSLIPFFFLPVSHSPRLTDTISHSHNFSLSLTKTPSDIYQ